MFYLTKRTRIEACKVGDRVMVLSDYPGGNIQAGEKGIIDKIYGNDGAGLGGGISIRWEKTGRCDGFGEDELEFLAFGTEAYSGVTDDACDLVLSDDEATALSVLDEATTEDLQALWDAIQDRTTALLPYPSEFAATYLKTALERVCTAIAVVQKDLAENRTGNPRDVVLTVSPAPGTKARAAA